MAGALQQTPDVLLLPLPWLLIETLSVYFLQSVRKRLVHGIFAAAWHAGLRDGILYELNLFMDVGKIIHACDELVTLADQ